MGFFARSLHALLTTGLLLASVVPAFAQQAIPESPGEQPPLLEMLALVPNLPELLDAAIVLSYVDYAGMQQARPDVPAFESYAEFDALMDSPNDTARLWMMNSMRIVAGPDFYLMYLRMFAETEELVGFDVFDIDRALVFGNPPVRGTILQGAFDVDAVTEAYLARDYAADQNNGVILLASADGEPGTRQNLQQRNVAIPFGGALGRREPIAVTESYILNSPDDALLEAMVNAFVGYRPSLYTLPDLNAAAEAISIGQGQLLQALFLNPLSSAFPATDLGLLLSPDVDLDALLNANPHGYGPLPPYTAAVLADLQDGGDQVALVALVYADEATARAAANELTARLADFPHRAAATDEPLLALVDGAVVGKPNVYFSPGTGRYVALASVRYPMPDNVLVNASTGEPLAEGETAERTSFLASGRLFRLWFDNLQQRTFDVLMVTE